MSIIRQLREISGLTQDELAQRIGRTQTYISLIESGSRQRITLKDGVKIAKQFSISAEDLDTAIENGVLPVSDAKAA